MKKTLLASVAILALMAATPALADPKDKDKGTTQSHSGGSSGGRHDDAGGTAGSGHTGGSGGADSHVNVVRGGHDDTAGHSGGTGGSNMSQGSGGRHFGNTTQGAGSTANPLAGGSNMSQGSGGRHFGNTAGGGKKGAGSTANPLTGGTMSGGIRGIGQDDSRTRGDKHDNHAGISEGSGGRHGSAAAIFGIGGHGYKSTAQFGHSRHNSAFDSYRKAVHSSHRYHDGTYHRPSGWYEHTWNYGDFLPALFFADRYQIDDYDSFGLSDPPDGTVWVRYGDDALLVDDETGEIIQVVYGIFY